MESLLVSLQVWYHLTDFGTSPYAKFYLVLSDLCSPSLFDGYLIAYRLLLLCIMKLMDETEVSILLRNKTMQ